MFTVLFRPGALDPDAPNATAAISTTYWMAFAAFFFGLTYGLLQICTEASILRRESFVGLRIGSYLAQRSRCSPRCWRPSSSSCSSCSGPRSTSCLRPGHLWAHHRHPRAHLAGRPRPRSARLGRCRRSRPGDAGAADALLPRRSSSPVRSSRCRPWTPVAARSAWSWSPAGRSRRSARRPRPTSLLAGDPAGAGPAILTEYGDTFGRSPARNWIVLVLFTSAFVAATASVIRRRTTI